MRVISPASLAEVIAAFLRAELDSPTEAGRVRSALAALGESESVILQCEPLDAALDERRWRLFKRYRGGETLFETLDLTALRWQRLELDAVDLRNRVRTSRHGYERRFGTRRIAAIAQSAEVRDTVNAIATRLTRGEVLEPPILVGLESLDRLVVLEGHHRLISYVGRSSEVLFPLPAFVGTSRTVTGWREW